MLREIQVDVEKNKIFALDENYDIMATFECGTDFYDGENEYGQAYCNAPSGVYIDGTYAEAKGINADEMAYGWGYINIDERGHAIHGGGSNLGYPECYAPLQDLTPTLGCFRLHNIDAYWLAVQFIEAENMGFKPVIHVV